MQQEYKCPKCNSAITYGSPLCDNCGQRFTWKQPPQSPPRQSAQTPQYQQQQPESLSHQGNEAGTSGRLFYEDDPWAYLRPPYRERVRGQWSRDTVWALQITPLVMIIAAAGISLLLTQVDHEVGFISILGAMLFLMIGVLGVTYPTKYQIFNDRIRIVLGYILHFDIRFSNIDKVTVPAFGDLWGLNLNFINSYSYDDMLQIARKRGVKVHITPWNRKLFLEHLYKALIARQEAQKTILDKRGLTSIEGQPILNSLKSTLEHEQKVESEKLNRPVSTDPSKKHWWIYIGPRGIILLITVILVCICRILAWICDLIW